MLAQANQNKNISMDILTDDFTFALNEINIENNVSKRVQLAKVGTFSHDVYGNISITRQDLEDMKINFDNNVRRQTIDGRPVLPFDYSHKEDGKSSGWIFNLEIGKDHKGKDSLFGQVEWTEEAAKSIKNKEFKFVSPSIRRNYKDSETGQVFKIVLSGAGLTNIPFLRDMEAIHLLSENRKKAFESLKLSGDNPDITQTNNFEEGVKMKTLEEIMSMISQMSPEDKKKIIEALANEFENNVSEQENMAQEDDMAKKENIEKMSEQLQLSEKNNKELIESVSNLTKEINKMKKVSEFNILLSEGRVCEAQRESFLSDDLVAFAKAAVNVKLDEIGSNRSSNLSDDPVEKINKLAETLMKENKEMNYGSAVTQVLSENPELASAYEEV